MYQVHILRAVRKDLKKLPKEVAHKIVHFYFSQIGRNPYRGIKLSGVLKEYYKFACRIKNVDYRIIYQILEKEKVVVIIAVGKKEKFYARLLKRIK